MSILNIIDKMILIIYYMDMQITQKELSIRLGYCQRHINQVFRRRTMPSVSLAKKIERETGIPWTSWFDKADKSSGETRDDL